MQDKALGQTSDLQKKIRSILPRSQTLKRQQTRIYTDIDKSILSCVAPEILDMCDLDIETMAKYKALKKHDLFCHDQIAQKALRRRSVRRLVFEEEISDLSDLENRMDGQNSSSSSLSKVSGNTSFDSQASKVAFWKDINTKDSDYKNAVILNRSRESEKRVRSLRKKKAGPIKINQDKLQIIKNNLRINNQPFSNIINQNQIQYAEEKIMKMQKVHQMEMRNIKNMSVQYAIEYFKTKSQDLNKIFTQEIFEVLDQYDILRIQSNQKDSRIQNLEKLV